MIKFISIILSVTLATFLDNSYVGELYKWSNKSEFIERDSVCIEELIIEN